MKRFFYGILAIVILLAVGLTGYGAYLNQAGEGVIARRMESQALRLSGAVAARRIIHPVLQWERISLYSDRMTDVITQVSGVVENVSVTTRDQVAEGQPILHLRNREVSLRITRTEGRIARARAEETHAYRTYMRYLQLAEADAVSKQRLDEAEAYYLETKAAIKELEAEQETNYLMQEYQTVRAPISGQLLMMYRQPGTYVSSGTPVCMVGDFSTMWFRTEMPDSSVQYLLPLGSMNTVVFQRADFAKVYGGDYGAGNEGRQQSFEARLYEVNPPLEEAAGMRSIVMAIDNSSGMLEPKSYRMMRMQSGAALDVLAVPLKAMLDQKRDRVFIRNSEGCLELRRVKTGADDGEYIEIREGLAEGDVVITSNPNELLEGSRVEVILADEGE